MRNLILIAVSWISVILIIGCRDSDIQIIEEVQDTPTSVTQEPVGIEITLKPRITQTIASTGKPTDSTPAIKPSVTPAPSPISYSIIEGDTVSGIASRFGISVNEIQALNPALTPELLLIGQEIHLPASELEPVSLPVETEADRFDLEISGLATYRTPLNDLWILGAVQNKSAQSFGNVRVIIQVQDSSGSFESIAEVTVPSAFILPGEAGPFGYLFEEPPIGELTFSAEVQSANVGVEPSIRSKDLIIEDARVTIENNKVTYGGSIRNSGQDTVENIQLVTIIFDEDSFVSGYHTVAIDGQLSPGLTVLYEFDTITPGTVNELVSFAHGMRTND